MYEGYRLSRLAQFVGLSCPVSQPVLSGDVFAAHLARVCIASFKGFADPVALNILPDLTGLVGSNGCGKRRWCIVLQTYTNRL